MLHSMVMLGLLVNGVCYAAGLVQHQEKDSKKLVEPSVIQNLLSEARSDAPKLLALVKQYPALCKERIERGHYPIMLYVALSDISQIPSFLEAGVPINQQDSDGMTALMRAVHKESPKIVRSLLENKARLDIVDDTGCDAVMHALSYAHGGPIAEELIQRPPFSSLVNRAVGLPYTRGGQKYTYLRKALGNSMEWYVYQNRVVDTLLKAGAKVEVADVLLGADRSLRFFKMLLPHCSRETLQTVRSRIVAEYKGHCLRQRFEQEIDAALARLAQN